MANIKIHAGDFNKGKGTLSFMFGKCSITPPYGDGDKWAPTAHPITAENIEEISLATEENVKRIGGTVGWGIAGAALLGPLGLLAGVLLGGKGKDITFILKLKDGRKMLATTDSKSYTKLSALAF
ncbi:hypothetical protein [Acinetobacter oleivorans]|jgi:hypothetical protein|uniref:Uncharacterized protein n=1 Tax=Acinetobacter oleivorans (strain JCM 16667 / KCTC 23045 / DR1) TaxID=436717 RepID=A0AAN0UD51_ACISD|nr:hypothetical protein [Acinetobacter oleivorans]ADI90765.1 hypothetical protein AOLE_09380 [Acinetobacter oleivorans DR1]ESK45519.1 hypothetical protein P254_01130 [Acinetobacter oleivorans CIP 110421]